MKDAQIAIAALTGIILFVFGLEHFSKEIQRITGEKFRKFIGRVTERASVGVLIGAVVTALIQSSSATSVIAISLVNAGVLSFKNSVGIVFGSNIGTTITAQLVAFKLTAFAPLFIIVGFLLSFVRNRIAIFGKSLFYFGFVFFTLNLISDAIAPLQSDPRLMQMLAEAKSPIWGVLVGTIITAIVQSSSVTTGLAVIFAQQGILGLENAIPIVMGANLGTTVTAFISMVSMDISAKKTAVAHIFFNIGGVLLFFPILYYYPSGFGFFTGQPAVDLATFHLIFNLSTSIAFLIGLKYFTLLIDKIMGEGKMDFERIDIPQISEDLDIDPLEKKLLETLKHLFSFLQENYNLVTLSIETNYRQVYETSKKRIEYIEFVKAELQTYFSHMATSFTEQKDIKALIKIMNLYEYLFQIHDSICDLSETKANMDANYIELRSDILLHIRDLASRTLNLFEVMDLEHQTEKTQIDKNAKSLQNAIDEFNKTLLKLMSHPDRPDAAAILHMVTYNQRLKDKLMNYNTLLHK